jgi:eight-cysteine-cluster-containing protein
MVRFALLLIVAVVFLAHEVLAQEVLPRKPDQQEDFCGRSTHGNCATDSGCVKGGCSGQVCQSKDEEPVITTCEWRECYNASAYGLGCVCVNEQCRWHKR